MTKLISVLSIALAVAVVSVQNVRADDAAATAMFEEAKALYNARSSTSLDSINASIAKLDEAAASAEDSLLKYDILILSSRAYYFKGTHVSSKEDKKTIHKLGQEKADAADKLNSDFAEAPYFAGINLGRWGEANGIIASLTQVPQLKKYMAAAIERFTRDEKDGESVDAYGPHRTLGRMFKKLPGMFGGSHTESVKHLEQAYKAAPEQALNVVYLGDTLIKDGNAAEKAEGTKIINEMLAKDPNTLSPERVVETLEEYELARKVLAGKEIE